MNKLQSVHQVGI